MSDEVVFSMTKRRLGAFAVCVGLAIVILYLAGVITGMLIAPVTPKAAAATKTVVPSPAPMILPAKSVPSEKPTASDATPPGALAVQVASFLDQDRAERFAASLKRQGFENARVDDIASAEQTWHVVRLGPYHDWDSAAQVAAEIGRSYDLHCSVRPL